MKLDVSPEHTGRRDVRLALVRAGFVSLAGLFGARHPLSVPVFAAVAFFVIVPATLVELRASPTIETPRHAFRAGLASLAVAFGLVLAAYFQGVYASEVLATGSLGAGMTATQTHLASWLAVTGRASESSLFVVYAGQCCGIATACTLVLRKPGVRKVALLLFASLVASLPVVDWLALAALERRTRPGAELDELPILIGASIVALGVGSLVATTALFAAAHAADRATARSSPRTP